MAVKKDLLTHSQIYLKTYKSEMEITKMGLIWQQQEQNYTMKMFI